ncbi:hypothetical protein JKF63_00120 [Porcisia hertigi]|uniref:BILBO1 N-terminal domain-containing protein n=1 Tax=Porcisia hertigi TaxID=2761500 RepID=A0A836I4F5_9TRYP|nr:hypothetical protein JKF63_00120 [Porcisia hertigi]
MFTLLCCADLGGEKVNLEVTLDALPASIQSLRDDLARIFSCEVQGLLALENRRDMVQPFQVMAVYIYDDVLLRWTKLKSVTQLHPYDQLYVFQPATQCHGDAQKRVPPPRQPAMSQAHSITRDSAPPASFHGNGDASSLWSSGDARTQSPAAANIDTTHKVAPTRSPARAQLEEQRLEEERLAHRLSLVRSERLRLEREAQREEEDERRQRALETDLLLKSKEEEIWSKRDALSRAEEEFRRFLAEKQQLIDHSRIL